MTMDRQKMLLCGMLLMISGGLTAQKSEELLDSPLPVSWTGDDDEVFMQSVPIDNYWWKRFGDPTLDSLINLAMERNHSVLTALSRMEQARYEMSVTRSTLLPTIGISGGWNRQQTGASTSDESRSWSGKYNLTAAVNWEIDLFGSIRKRLDADRANFRASEEEVNAVLLSLAAQVTVAYINLRQYQQEREVLLSNCRSQQAVVELTEARRRSGLSSTLDVVQARSVYYGTLASVPVIEADIIRMMNSLAVLLGSYPQNMIPGLAEVRPLPEYVEAVGVGVPAGLLRRRPDIRQAEFQVDVQTSLYGVSKKTWLPQFFIAGSVGYGSERPSGLFEAEGLSWQITPTFSWTLFDGGGRYNSNRQARAALEEAVSAYNQTVLQAVQEVENAMAAYKNSVKQILSTRQALNMSEEALNLSLDLYKQGLSPFQNVLDAQRSRLGYEDALVQAQSGSLLNLVQLYQALGGGLILE